MSAQARTYHVPADGNVYALVAVFEAPIPSAALAYVPMSLAFDPLLSVARWKRSVKPAGVATVPAFVIVAESVTGVPTVAVVGVTVEAVRSAWAVGPAMMAIQPFGPPFGPP